MTATTEAVASLRKAPSALARALRSAVAWQVGWPLFYSFLIPACELCDELMTKALLEAITVFWLWVGYLLLARRNTPSHGDLFSIANGLPILSLGSWLCVHAAYEHYFNIWSAFHHVPVWGPFD